MTLHFGWIYKKSINDWISEKIELLLEKKKGGKSILLEDRLIGNYEIKTYRLLFSSFYREKGRSSIMQKEGMAWFLDSQHGLISQQPKCRKGEGKERNESEHSAKRSNAGEIALPFIPLRDQDDCFSRQSYRRILTQSWSERSAWECRSPVLSREGGRKGLPWKRKWLKENGG